MPFANFIQRRPATVFSSIVMSTVVAVGVFFDHLDAGTRERQRQIATTPAAPPAEASDSLRILQTRMMGASQESRAPATSGERKPL